MSDDPLFDLLGDPPVKPELKEPRLGAVGVTWTRYNGTRKPCDLCVKLIHDHGVQGAPPPDSAAHKRTGPNDVLLLCNVHGEEMRRKDKQAEDDQKARIAAAGEARKYAINNRTRVGKKDTSR